MTIASTADTPPTLTPETPPEREDGSDRNNKKNNKKKNNKKSCIVKQPPIPAGWDRCHFYMIKKGRYCRQQPSANSTHCGNHVHLLDPPTITTEEEDVTTDQEDMNLKKRSRPHEGKNKRRIPCPIDPSHTIYEYMVHKHVLICPKAKRLREEQSRPFYKHNENCGGMGAMGETPVESLSGDSDNSNSNSERARKVAFGVLRVYMKLFMDDSSTNVSDDGATITDNCNVTFDKMYSSIPLQDLSRFEEQSGLSSSLAQARIRAGGPKHVQQQGSILGHLRRVDLLTTSDKPNIILEMGAGRGMLGLVVAGVTDGMRQTASPTNLIMVERSGSRYKADGRVRCAKRDGATTSTPTRPYLKIDELLVERIDCDLAHIHLPVILPPSKGESAVTVVAKHLCGAGTDLALKSLRDVGPSMMKGCAFATCCHGVCSWEEYVNRDFLRRVFFEEFDGTHFELLRRWSSGTTQTSATPADNDNDNDHNGGDGGRFKDSVDGCGVWNIVRDLKLNCGIEGLGRACQRILDYGRMEYVKERLGMDKVLMCHYVNKDVTPQNALFMGWKEPNK